MRARRKTKRREVTFVYVIVIAFEVEVIFSQNVSEKDVGIRGL